MWWHWNEIECNWNGTQVSEIDSQTLKGFLDMKGENSFYPINLNLTLVFCNHACLFKDFNINLFWTKIRVWNRLDDEKCTFWRQINRAFVIGGDLKIKIGRRQVLSDPHISELENNQRGILKLNGPKAQYLSFKASY